MTIDQIERSNYITSSYAMKHAYVNIRRAKFWTCSKAQADFIMEMLPTMGTCLSHAEECYALARMCACLPEKDWPRVFEIITVTPWEIGRRYIRIFNNA
jgi:hypothetical protein